MDTYNDATPNLAKWNLCGNPDRSSKSSESSYLPYYNHALYINISELEMGVELSTVTLSNWMIRIEASAPVMNGPFTLEPRWQHTATDGQAFRESPKSLLVKMYPGNACPIGRGLGQPARGG
jgi:hypothetical protein